MNQQEKWWQGAVVYQIYPRSFKDSNNDGIGDLRGIIEKLDYLNDGTENSLGVDAIWLNPIYKSPQKDFGYDVSDYCDIDPIFGDLATFDELISEARRRGIKVLMDFVPNHTSSEHPWFLESKSSKNNSKRDWYIWKDAKPDGSAPNNWLSVFGGPAWTFDENTKQYYLRSFLSSQPDLNWRNPEVRKEMRSVLNFWLSRGVDGFRTDAVYYLIKDAEFRDDPLNPNYTLFKDNPYDSLLHIHSAGREEGLNEINSLCEVLEESGNKFMISEAYLKINEMMRYYGACKNNRHAPFNLNLLTIPWDAGEFKKFVDEFETILEPENVPTYALGNHDKRRVATRLGQERAHLLAALSLTLRGMAFVYYGEELGMENAIIPLDKTQDPWSKNLPSLGFGRDAERTPMQWDDSRFVGFSQVAPWLPFFSKPEIYNVKTEQQNARSAFHLYRQLIQLRKKYPALRFGTYQPMKSENPNIFTFARVHRNQKIQVVLNFSEKEQQSLCDDRKGILLYNIYLDKKAGEEMNIKTCILRPYECYVFTF